MTGISFATDTITVVRPAWIIERGDQIPDWAAATTHAVTGCRLQPADGEEVRDQRDALVTRWALFAPLAVDIDYRDRIVHDGVTYEVDGDIRRWRSATGTLAHAEATLRRVDG